MLILRYFLDVLYAVTAFEKGGQDAAYLNLDSFVGVVQVVKKFVHAKLGTQHLLSDNGVILSNIRQCFQRTYQC